MRSSQWQQGFTAAVVLLLVMGGCGKTPSGETQASPVSGRSQVDASTSGRYRVQTTADGVRLYLDDQTGDGGTLIRCFPAAAAPAVNREPDGEQALMSREDEPTRLWEACMSRVASGRYPDALTEHDAWLETAGRLEERLQQDPEHLGVLRDLIVAYLDLLSFEASSPLGSNLCLLTGRRISEFEARAAPLDPPDRQLVDQGRALLFQAMKLYPCVAEMLNDAKVGPQGDGLRRTLGALGQARFAELERDKAGPLTLRTFRTLGSSPDPGLLWEELHFVLSSREPFVPESTVAYVLVRQGTGEQARYY